MPDPQIAFVDTVGWAICGPFFSKSGLHAYRRMPPVSCPLVDTTPVQDHQALSQLLARTISPECVKELEALLADLTAIGCQVSMLAELPQPVVLAGLEYTDQ